MPCNDVTELIEVVLDRNDRLKEYRFSKRTCGQGVGAQSLLIDQLGGRPLNELLVMTAEEFLTEYPIDDPVEEFLSLKHLFAVPAVPVFALHGGGPQTAEHRPVEHAAHQLIDRSAQPGMFRWRRRTGDGGEGFHG